MKQYKQSLIRSTKKNFNQQMIEAIKHLSTKDLKIKSVIEQVGRCGLKPHTRYFESLVDAVISQQLSMFAAQAIFKRFVDYYAPKKFPDTMDIINTPTENLRALGISYAKIRCLKDLCSKIESGLIHLRRIPKLTDEEIVNELIQVKGIGVWTAHMFLIFSLGRLNVLPTEDLGIKKGIMKLYGLKKIPDGNKIEYLSQKHNWSPYNSIASWYIWKSLELNENAKTKN